MNTVSYSSGMIYDAQGIDIDLLKRISQLAMRQNASMLQWTFEEVDAKLRRIMTNTCRSTSETAREFGQPGNLVLGANIVGFRKVADAMIDQGVV